MSYTLYQSNSLENLICNNLDCFMQENLFENNCRIIVQSRNMAEWIKLKIADLSGISANLDFKYPEQALREIASEYPLEESKKHVLHMDNLKVIIFKKLEELLSMDTTSKDFISIFNFVTNGDSSLSNDRFSDSFSSSRLYEISDAIAGLFYQYGMNHLELIKCWESDSLMIPGNSHEIWQKKLWFSLFNDSSLYIHLSLLLEKITESGIDYPGKKMKIILFGSTFLGDRGWSFFHHLSKSSNIEIHHFLLTPSESYLINNKKNVSNITSSFSTLISGFKLLANSFEPKIENVDDQNETFFANSLLGNLQRSFWNDDFSKFDMNEITDGTFRVIDCPGTWRQVETLRDDILKELDSDPELKLTDIAVVAPDINQFSPYIEAIFPAIGEPENLKLNYNIIDLSITASSPFLDGFQKIISLTEGRFSAEELFDIFRNPAVQQKFRYDSSDVERWHEIVLNLNIVWGYDENSRSREGFSKGAQCTWEAGFKQFLFGLTSLDDDLDNGNYSYSIDDETFHTSVGKMIHIVRSLAADIEVIKSISMPLDEWIRFVEKMMDTYLAIRPSESQDQYDRQRLKKVFRDQTNLFNDLGKLESLDNSDFRWNFIRRFESDLLSQNSVKMGKYLTGGISCGSLKPLRALPFKQIYILGMELENFPRSDEYFSFDLRPEVSPVIDLTRRGSDRFSFLETLISAKDKLTILFNGRNRTSGEKELPSTLINEIFDIIDSCMEYKSGKTADLLSLKAPLQPFDFSLYSNSALKGLGLKPLYSYSIIGFNEAKALLEDKKSYNNICFEVDRELPESITLSDLISFIKDPFIHYCNKSLGIYLDLDIESTSLPSEEPFEFNFFDLKSKRSEYINESASGHNSEKYFDNEWNISIGRGDLYSSRYVKYEKDNFDNGNSAIVDSWNQINDKYKNLTHNSKKCSFEYISSKGPIRITADIEYLTDENCNCFRTVNYAYGSSAKISNFIKPFISFLLLSKTVSDNLKWEACSINEEGNSEKEWNRTLYGFNDFNDSAELFDYIVELYITNLSKPLFLKNDLVPKIIALMKGDDSYDNFVVSLATAENADRSSDFSRLNNDSYLTYFNIENQEPSDASWRLFKILQNLIEGSSNE